MKYHFEIVLFFCLIACQSSVKDDDLELTSFTKDLICLYLDDVGNISTLDGTEEMILLSFEDDTCCHLSLFANNPKKYTYCRGDYIGRTTCMNHIIKAYGTENSLFFLLNKGKKKNKRCAPSYIEFDPIVWSVCLYKDGSMCTQETYKCTPEEDITNIQSLVDRHFGISCPRKDEPKETQSPQHNDW